MYTDTHRPVCYISTVTISSLEHILYDLTLNSDVPGKVSLLFKTFFLKLFYICTPTFCNGVQSCNIQFRINCKKVFPMPKAEKFIYSLADFDNILCYPPWQYHRTVGSVPLVLPFMVSRAY